MVIIILIIFVYFVQSTLNGFIAEKMGLVLSSTTLSKPKPIPEVESDCVSQIFLVIIQFPLIC